MIFWRIQIMTYVLFWRGNWQCGGCMWRTDSTWETDPSLDFCIKNRPFGGWGEKKQTFCANKLCLKIRLLYLFTGIHSIPALAFCRLMTTSICPAWASLHALCSSRGPWDSLYSWFRLPCRRHLLSKTAIPNYSHYLLLANSSLIALART